MLIGYARTSTIDQRNGLDAQVEALTRLGCERVFKEQVSAAGERHQLKRALAFLKDGDTLAVTKLDRLARSTKNLIAITDVVLEKKAQLRILDLGVDTSTPIGKLMLTMIGAVAQFEREIMLERQREGIIRAQRALKYKNRTNGNGTSPEQIQRLIHLIKVEGMAPQAAAIEIGVSRNHGYKLLRRAGVSITNRMPEELREYWNERRKQEQATATTPTA